MKRFDLAGHEERDGRERLRYPSFRGPLFLISLDAKGGVGLDGLNPDKQRRVQ